MRVVKSRGAVVVLILIFGSGGDGAGVVNKRRRSYLAESISARWSTATSDERQRLNEVGLLLDSRCNKRWREEGNVVRRGDK